MNNKIYTDGSYRDGKGTFAIDIYNDIQRVKEITAICDANSSNKTELLAVLYALHQNKTKNQNQTNKSSKQSQKKDSGKAKQ